MPDRFFDVEIVITKNVRVRVPSEIVRDGEAAEDAAEEFATGGKAAWPRYVIKEGCDLDVESVTEVFMDIAKTAA